MDAGILVDAGAVVALPVTPVNPDDIGGVISALYNAIRGGQWVIAAGAVLVGLVWAARKWLPGLSPWFKTDRGGVVLTVAMSFIGALATSLLAGKLPGVQDLIAAVTVAASAMGIYTGTKRVVAPKDG